MPIRNSHWYAENAGRAYPVDDAASCADDRGVRLPPDIVVDMNLRWPRPLGRYAFLTAVSVTPALVTLTVQACDSPDAAEGLVPLAVVSARRPVGRGRVVALVPQAPGVAGWVTFGGGVDGEAYHGRFSTPAQSRLAPRAARAYRPPPVSSLQALNAADRLAGVVTLKVSEPLAVAREERVIDGVVRDCIVVRLVDDNGADGFPVPAAAADITGYRASSVFQRFAGPCFGRPESHTCGCPDPVEFVNAVAPDCDGTITMEFRGCAQVAQIQELCGVAVACQFGLVDACLPSQVPTSDGLLPSEVEPVNVPVPPDVPPPPPPAGVSESFHELPAGYLYCFGDASVLAVAHGDFALADDSSPTAVCGSTSLSASDSTLGSVGSGSLQSDTASTRCVATSPDDVTTVYRRAVTEARMTQGPLGARRNAQLVVNYRAHTTVPDRFVYYAAEVNYDRQSFRVVRFDGQAFSVLASVTVPGIQLGPWYRIQATVRPGPAAGQVEIAAHFETVDDPAGPGASVSAVTDTYQPSDGKFGVGTDRAVTRFAYLQVVEETP